MDPYLERHWGDVHQALVTYIRDQLQPSLPEDLRARMQERVYIESADAGHEYYPDVRIIERPGRLAAGGGTSVAAPASTTRAEDGAPTPAQPIVIHLDNEPVTEGYIEIVDVKSGHRVITSIEVLSPANKHAGEGQRLFRQKREDMKRASVNMVEIDLLRGGDRVLMIPREQIPPSLGRITRSAPGVPHNPAPSFSTRSHSANDCRSSGCRCGRPIRRRCSTSRPSWISVIGMAATTTSTTPTSPSRASRRVMPPGPTPCSVSKAGVEIREPESTVFS